MWSMGVCVPNFRSVSFYISPVGEGISSPGCSPHVDFDNCNTIVSKIIFECHWENLCLVPNVIVELYHQSLDNC